jgi:peptidase M28-like protein/PDZ domain-containing protein/PA domain-containing protein
MGRARGASSLQDCRMQRSALLAVLLAACATGGPPRAPPKEDAAVARARAEIAWLADAARGGRGVGTEGGDEAARWVAARFEEAGLAPAYDEGYLQWLEAPYRATLKAGNTLRLGSEALTLEQDFIPFGFSDDGTVEAEVVYAGHGITAPDLRHDDYAGLDVKGKIVLVAQDFPREADPASPFRDPAHYRLAEWRYKAINARDHGAAAMLAVRDVWAHDGPDELPPWRGQVSSRAGLLAARVTAAALARAGLDVRALAAAAEEGGRAPAGAPPLRGRLSVEVQHERARTANVVAILPGRDPAVAGECVVIGAHHDHLGLGGDASLAPDQIGAVHPGADDNASGVAALLAVARASAAEGPTRRTLVFAAFAAEELGLLGSAHLVGSPPRRCPVERMQLMVNLDMVGRPREGKVYVQGTGTAKGRRDEVRAVADRAPRVPLTLAFGASDGYGPSDHTSFYARDVPVLYLFSGAHADYHRPSDTADKVDAAAVAAVAGLAFRAVRGAADRAGRLEVVRAAGPPPPQDRSERGYGTYLGAIPDFAERAEPGVLLTGVRAGSPAERGGLAAKDVLVRVGATRVMNLQDLAFALRSHRPGDAVEVEWTRAGERRTATVKLEERR